MAVRRKVGQAEGCPVITFSIPKPSTKIEISLDIGSPSFRYVEHKRKVIHPWPISRAFLRIQLKYDFADMLTAFHQPVAFDHITERKDLVNVRCNGSVFDERPDLL